MEYKPDIGSVVERHRLLWNRKLPNGILAKIDVYNQDFPNYADDLLRHCPDIEKMFADWDAYLNFYKDVKDDAFPVARASFGSYAFGAFLGAKITFTESGGWAEPLPDDWTMLEDLRFEEDNCWIRKQKELVAYFVKHGKGKFAIAPTETIDALNFAENLRGPQVYMDIYDYPEKIKQLMEFGLEFNIKLIELQRSIIGTYKGGVFDLFYTWLPGRAVWLSVDAYAQCLPHVFVDMGYSYIQRLIDHFGNGWLHIHSNGISLLPELVKLKGLMGIGVYDDPGQLRGFERLREIRSITKDIPLQINCSSEELEKGIRDGTLPGGIMYWVKGVDSVEYANELMDRVRSYRTKSDKI